MFNRDEILDHAYSNMQGISDRNIDTHIKNIRKKISKIADVSEQIRSVYGIGYKFNKQ